MYKHIFYYSLCFLHKLKWPSLCDSRKDSKTLSREGSSCHNCFRVVLSILSLVTSDKSSRKHFKSPVCHFACSPLLSVYKLYIFWFLCTIAPNSANVCTAFTIVQIMVAATLQREILLKLVKVHLQQIKKLRLNHLFQPNSAPSSLRLNSGYVYSIE